MTAAALFTNSTNAKLAETSGETDSDAIDDSELVERAKGDRTALAVLYRRHQPRISRYILRRVGDAHEAEDLTANVFLAMVAALPRFRASETPFVAWLYRIATNEINAWMRKRRLRRFFGLVEDIVAPAASNDESEALRAALARLPLHYQTALALHYLEELTIEEISRIANIAHGTVKSRLSRGREALRRLLEPQETKNA